MLHNHQIADVASAADRAIQRAESRGIKPRALDRVCLLLLVDDDSAVAAAVAAIARTEGLEPLYANTLTAASALLAAHDVRRAIVDWRLGQGTALTLLAALRERGIDRVVYTGFTDDPAIPSDETVIAKPGIEALRAWMRRGSSCAAGAGR